MTRSKGKTGNVYIILGFSMMSGIFFLTLIVLINPWMIQRFSEFVGQYMTGLFPGDHTYILYFLLYFLLPLIFILVLLVSKKICKNGIVRKRRYLKNRKK